MLTVMRWCRLGLVCVVGGCGPLADASTSSGGATAHGSSGASDDDSTGPGVPPTSSTGEPAPTPVDPEAACAAHCDAVAACRQVPVDAMCAATCLDGLGGGGGDPQACRQADATLLACVATLPCDVLLAEAPQRACDPELRVMLGACGLCTGGAGWVDADTCFMDELCEDGLLRVECDATTCVCTEDGAFIRACPSNGCDSDGLPGDGLQCCRDAAL